MRRRRPPPKTKCEVILEPVGGRLVHMDLLGEALVARAVVCFCPARGCKKDEGLVCEDGVCVGVCKTGEAVFDIGRLVCSQGEGEDRAHHVVCRQFVDCVYHVGIWLNECVRGANVPMRMKKRTFRELAEVEVVPRRDGYYTRALGNSKVKGVGGGKLSKNRDI